MPSLRCSPLERGSLRQLARELRIPDALVRIVTKATAQSAEDRHGAASELRSDLLEVLGAIGAAPAAEGVPASQPPADDSAKPAEQVDERGDDRDEQGELEARAERGKSDEPGTGGEPDEGEERAEGDAGERAAAAGAIGTTMKSQRDSAVDAAGPRGAKVQVLMGEAAPATDEEPVRRSEPRASGLQRKLGTDDPRERRLWAIAAVIAALAAVAVGIWLGVR